MCSSLPLSSAVCHFLAQSFGRSFAHLAPLPNSDTAPICQALCPPIGNLAQLYYPCVMSNCSAQQFLVLPAHSAHLPNSAMQHCLARHILDHSKKCTSSVLSSPLSTLLLNCIALDCKFQMILTLTRNLVFKEELMNRFRKDNKGDGHGGPQSL